MHFHRIGRLAASALLAVVASDAGARAEDKACDGATIRVEAREEGDRQAACGAVAVASAFFLGAGLRMPEDMVVRLVSDGDAHPLGESEIGRYDAARREVVLRDYRSYRTVPLPASDGAAARGAFASIPFWQSWIVHELTHAAIHATCGGACLSRGMHEYVAAVVQMATLEAPVRAAFLAQYGYVEAYGDTSEVSASYYEINPRYFIVKSYKHYEAQPDSHAYLRTFVSSLRRR